MKTSYTISMLEFLWFAFIKEYTLQYIHISINNLLGAVVIFFLPLLLNVVKDCWLHLPYFCIYSPTHVNNFGKKKIIKKRTTRFTCHCVFISFLSFFIFSFPYKLLPSFLLVLFSRLFIFTMFSSISVKCWFTYIVVPYCSCFVVVVVAIINLLWHSFCCLYAE